MPARRWRFAVLIGFVAPLIACAETADHRTPPRSNGILPTPQAMRAGEPGEPALLSLDAATVWYSYTRMILQPVTLWAGPYGAGLESMPPADRIALANAAFSELNHVAGQLCEMVDRPGPNTLIVNAALVDAATADPTLVTTSATLPEAWLQETIGNAPFDPGAGAFMGRAVLQLVARDAATGAVLWQAVDRRAADAAGATPLDSWHDVTYALKSIAAKFGNWLSLIGACT